MIVALMGGILVVGLLWYKQQQEQNGINGVVKLGTALLSL